MDIFKAMNPPRPSWVALGKFLREFVYFAEEICHRGTLPSATPSFPVGENFENRQKHRIRRSAWEQAVARVSAPPPPPPGEDSNIEKKGGGARRLA